MGWCTGTWEERGTLACESESEARRVGRKRKRKEKYSEEHLREE